MKFFGGLQPPNISRMWFREIFGGCRPPKYLTEPLPSNILGVYSPQKFDGWGSVKYFGAVHPQNISRNHIREIFWGLWGPMGVYGDLWGPMGAYGGLW